MKIKKFNETSIYNSCTKEDLIETQKKKKEILDFERETVYPMLVEYIRFNPKVTKEKNIKDIGNFSVISYYIYNDWIGITYESEDGNSEWIEISDKQFEDFLRYLENPELYKNAKKYNL